MRAMGPVSARDRPHESLDAALAVAPTARWVKGTRCEVVVAERLRSNAAAVVLGVTDPPQSAVTSTCSLTRCWCAAGVASGLGVTRPTSAYPGTCSATIAGLFQARWSERVLDGLEAVGLVDSVALLRPMIAWCVR